MAAVEEDKQRELPLRRVVLRQSEIRLGRRFLSRLHGIERLRQFGELQDHPHARLQVGRGLGVIRTVEHGQRREQQGGEERHACVHGFFASTSSSTASKA